jgi:hypothetical protein
LRALESVSLSFFAAGRRPRPGDVAREPVCRSYRYVRLSAATQGCNCNSVRSPSSRWSYAWTFLCIGAAAPAGRATLHVLAEPSPACVPAASRRARSTKPSPPPRRAAVFTWWATGCVNPSSLRPVAGGWGLPAAQALSSRGIHGLVSHGFTSSSPRSAYLRSAIDCRVKPRCRARVAGQAPGSNVNGDDRSYSRSLLQRRLLCSISDRFNT